VAVVSLGIKIRIKFRMCNHLLLYLNGRDRRQAEEADFRTEQRDRSTMHLLRPRGCAEPLR